MAGYSQFANLLVEEGTVNVPKTITFEMKPKKIIITNDSSGTSLLFRFNSNGPFATLLPTETVSLEVSIRSIHLDGIGADYRIWGLG